MKTISYEEIIKGCDHDGSYIPVKEVMRLMHEAATIAHNNAIEECAEEAEVEEWYPNPYSPEVSHRIDKQSILKLKVI